MKNGENYLFLFGSFHILMYKKRSFLVYNNCKTSVRMVLQLKSIITLLLVLIVSNSVSVCPSGQIDYDTLNMLAEEVMLYKSQNSNVFYRITYLNGNYLLNCYQITDQSSSPDPVLQIKNFSTSAGKSWQIKAVSVKGSCVGVQKDSTFLAYSTSSGSFVQIQSIDITGFGSKSLYSVSDDCSMIQVNMVDPSGAVSMKVFKNQVQVDSLVLPQGSLFTSDFAYAIDTFYNFYQLSNTSYISKKLPLLKTTPLYIKWSSLIKAVITVTKDSTGYTLYVIDPLNSANFYSKTFVKDIDYTGDLKYNIKSSLGTILLSDKKGFITMIQLNLVNSLIVSSTFTLDDSTTYSSTFNSTAYISISNNIIFVYNNQSFSYFQSYLNKIYFLGNLPSDVVVVSETYRIKYSPKIINIVLSLSSPSNLTLCKTTGTNTTSSATTTTANINTPYVVDQSTGLAIKCPDNCISCVSSQSCSICNVGYSLNDQSGKCVFCNGCLSCSPFNTSHCYLCFSPTILNTTTNTCNLPKCTVDNCLMCNANGQCTMCKAGYGLIGSLCQKCTGSGCGTCSKSVDSCDLNSCNLGYIWYLNPTSGKGTCQPCASGCDVCSTSDLSACSSCSAGYYSQPDSNGINRCVPCFANCKKCSSATVCTSCSTGYVPTADGSACTLKCSDNCLTCDQSSASTCTSCFAGSTLNKTSNKCVADTSCNSTGSCLFCSDGYVLSNGNCLKCQTSDSNCQSCNIDNLSVCEQCPPGYYLNSNTCNKCTNNCSICLSQLACVKCNDGYYLVELDASGTGNCQSCDSSCNTCSGTPTICTSCASGFVLQGSKCISNNQVAIQFVIQANVNNFIAFMQDLMNWIITQANNGQSPGMDDITEQQIALLKTEKYGSSIVSAVISANTSSNAHALTDNFTQALNSGQSISGYQIISGTATAKTSNDSQSQSGPNYTDAPATSSSSSKVGIIVGVVVPLAIILIVVTAIIGYKVYKSKQGKKNQQQNAQRMDTDGEKYSTKQLYSQGISQKI